MWTPKIPELIGLQVRDCDAVIMQCTVKVKMMSKGILHKVPGALLLQLCLKGFT